MVRNDDKLIDINRNRNLVHQEVKEVGPHEGLAFISKDIFYSNLVSILFYAPDYEADRIVVYDDGGVKVALHGKIYQIYTAWDWVSSDKGILEGLVGIRLEDEQKHQTVVNYPSVVVDRDWTKPSTRERIKVDSVVIDFWMVKTETPTEPS